MTRKLPLTFDARNVSRICSFNRLSALAGRVADSRLPRPVLSAAIKAYSSVFSVDMSESIRKEGEFETFADFFVRKLKPGSRPIARDPRGMVSPADGALHNYGAVTNGRIPQVKGVNYGIAELLGDLQAAQPYLDGTFATIYLSPSNYHRVHAPVAGEITGCRYIPGALYSVAPVSVNNLRNVFVTNERIAIHFSTRLGRVCAVMVGATIVGRVTLTFAGLSTNQGDPEQEITLPEPLKVKKGDEIGAFHLGSTVVLLMEGQWKPRLLTEGMPLRMGSAIFRK